MRIVLDTACLTERQAAQEYLKETLELPDYYGGNLDALYDCLTEMPEIEIYFDGEADSPYLRRIWRVFRAAARENPNLTVERAEELY